MDRVISVTWWCELGARGGRARECARLSGLIRLLLVLVGGVLLLTVQPSRASASGNANWAVGVEASLPANARVEASLPAHASYPGVSVVSVSCASPGNCAAVGDYGVSLGNTDTTQGLLVSETSGEWATGVEAPLPANASARPLVQLYSVSCGSAGNCTAVGSYSDSSGRRQGLLLSETAAAWVTGVEAPLPADAGINPQVDLGSVSCASVGNCTAVGDYTDSSGNAQGLLLSETTGAWATGVEAPLPADAGINSNAVVGSVSCASPGNCTAVGRYTDNSGDMQGLLLSDTAGAWGIGGEAPVPVGGVSCASAGNCAAIGGFGGGVLFSETSGMWAPGVEPPLPSNAHINQHPLVFSVSCAPAGACTAVGGYVDSSLLGQGLLLSETSGTWAVGVEASLPSDAAINPGAALFSVSCASAGNCSAVGDYGTDGVYLGNSQGLLLTETSGAWAPGVEASLPADADTNPQVQISSVSCASAGNCSAVGTYVDSTGSQHGLLLSAAPARPTVTVAAPAAESAGSPIMPSSVAATLTGGSSPTGTITFKVFGPQSSSPVACGSGGTTLGTATVSDNGTYHPSAAFTPTRAGDYWWYASYSGDTSDDPATSSCGKSMAETVVALGTSSTVRASRSRAVTGQKITYIATVRPTPDQGSVSFRDHGKTLSRCAAVAVNGTTGTAKCTTSYARAGKQLVQAAYSGTTHFAASLSNTLKQRISWSLRLRGQPSSKNGVVRVRFRCAAGLGGCRAKLTLTTTETVRGHTVLAISASHKRKHPNGKHRTCIVGGKQVRVAASTTKTITIKLNPTGRRLLSRFKRLPVKLTISLTENHHQNTIATRRLTLIKPAAFHIKH